MDPDRALGVVVVMGVSGAGKSTIGRALARRRRAEFVEGDLLHPPENVARMRAGLPLDDDAREPWLDAIARVIADHCRSGDPAVIACSALRRRYRERLRTAGPVRFVLLDVSAGVLLGRVTDRAHEFMPASLLDDQLATLEPPADDEVDVVVVGTRPNPADTVADVERALDDMETWPEPADAPGSDPSDSAP
ncbi:MAG: AAA family ATPase [Acidimicrobiia bacterium]|nr:AAA family ATPase [Acidimicrobiia bacterium]